MASVAHRICINAALEGAHTLPRDNLSTMYDAAVASCEKAKDGGPDAEEHLRQSGEDLQNAAPSRVALWRLVFCTPSPPSESTPSFSAAAKQPCSQAARPPG